MNRAYIFLLVSTPDQKKIDFFVPSNITSHYTCYCSILKAIFMLAEKRSATFPRHSMPQKPPPHTGTPALPPLQVQPDLHSPHWQCLLSPVLPYPSGTVLPLRQAALSFLWRHLHSLRYWTTAFSLPE